MSKPYGTPKKPTPEIMEWLNSSWGINNEGVLIWIRTGKTKKIEAGQPIYCGLQSNGYMVCRTSTKPRRTLKAHHLVWYFTTGEWPTQSIDHIDGNRSNNLIINLRLVTKEQNLCNSKPTKNRLLPKGVNKSYNNNYNAVIKINKRRIYLGYFKTVEEAAQAYKEASLRLQKEFSYYASQEVN
jgi:hypothetical protein